MQFERGQSVNIVLENIFRVATCKNKRQENEVFFSLANPSLIQNVKTFHFTALNSKVVDRKIDTT
jgi:hypothetical protein